MLYYLKYLKLKIFNIMKNLITHLMGGIGNQMFQYACAKAIAKRNNAKLILDTKTGFINDKVFQNSFYLNKFNIDYNKSNLIYFLQYLFLKKLVNKKNMPLKFNNRKFNILFEQNQNSLDNEILNYNMEKKENSWLWGYFQSEDYFADIKTDLFKDFNFRDIGLNFKTIFNKYKELNTVSLCIRMYEEVPGNSKVSVGGVLNIDFYNACIEEINSKIDNPFFLIFSTKYFDVFKNLNVNSNNCIFINNENGYSGTLDNLWLMSKSKNHIISNSTFHWWSAWFSEFNYKNPLIFAPNNFLNNRSVPNRWFKIDI